MPMIASIGTSLPPLIYPQNHAKEFAREFFSKAFPEKMDRLLKVFDNGYIKTRYLSVPFEWHYKNPGFQEKNALFLKKFAELAKQSILNCLQKVDMDPEEIDQIVFITTSGMVPQNFISQFSSELNMRRNVRCTTIWGQGCSGGAGGIARAYDLAQANPETKILVCCVETSSILFSADDVSAANLVQVSLFGDGAATVLVVGDSVSGERKWKGPQIMDTESVFIKETYGYLGFSTDDRGIRGSVSQQLPLTIENSVSQLVEEFLEKHKWVLSDIQHFMIHPGGKKILEACASSLQLPFNKLRYSWEVLEKLGNTLSCSILFVLEKEMEQEHHSGDVGLMLAFGPGLTCEQVLLKW